MIRFLFVLLVAFFATVVVLFGWQPCCCGISAPCCSNTIPATIHITFNCAAIPCFDGQTFTLTYQTGGTYTGWTSDTNPSTPANIKPFANCGDNTPVGFLFYCSGTNAFQLTVYGGVGNCWQFILGATQYVSLSTFASGDATCSPLSAIFRTWSSEGTSANIHVDPFNFGCTTPFVPAGGANFTITVSL